MIDTDNDAVGHAFYDYYKQGKASTLWCNIKGVGDDIVPIEYFFRSYTDMPEIEKTALSLCSGRILDVGAGSGCHTLALQEQGKDVTAIDISPLCVKTMALRGVHKVFLMDFFSVTDRYDTVLLLMNGLGIAKRIDLLPLLFKQLDAIMNPQGQLLCSSFDICDVNDADCNNREFYQEVQYQMRYKNVIGEPFDWFSIGVGKLRQITEANGFSMTVVKQGEEYEYLARITRKNHLII